MKIHPSAVIEDGAIIGDDCTIGPFCHVGPNVKLGTGADLKSHVAIAGNTTIGNGARIFPFASVGHEPQDLKYAGEETTLEIGDNCLIREGVTMNPGTAGDAVKTVIGNNCYFLANSHVAHDCQIGDGVIFSNAVLLAGHCKVGDNVIIGGGAAVHQFCRIGSNSFIGGLAGVENDLIPFGMALGNRAYLGGLNLIGMKRAGIQRESIHKARKAFKDLFNGSGSISENLNTVGDEFGDDPVVKLILDFINASGDRALCTPKG
ncbi:MAG: acyl-ACP--UDP-N-acetylglucosamine O-acyltransferase [Pseudomonadota bacterium]